MKYTLHVFKRNKIARAIHFMGLVHVSGLHCFQYFVFEHLINLYYKSIFVKQKVFEFSYIVYKMQAQNSFPDNYLFPFNNVTCLRSIYILT